MENITAEEFLKQHSWKEFGREEHTKILIDFAKLKCKEMQDAIIENSKLLVESNYGRYEIRQELEKQSNHPKPTFSTTKEYKKNHPGHGDCSYQILTIDEDSIRNAYDINSIK